MLFSLLLPLFVIAAGGAALARTRWMKPGWQQGVGELTVKLLIPALLLDGAYKSGMPQAVSWQVLGAFYLPFVALFVLTALATRRGEDGGARGLAAIYSNTAFVGIPVLIQVRGAGSLQFAFPVIAFHSLIAFTLYYLTTPNTGDGGRARQVLGALSGALRNPIVVSLFLGFALNLGGVALPAPLVRVLELMASAALPCSLLALGASLVGLHLRSLGVAALLAVLKLLVFPGCVLTLAHYVFHLPEPATAVLVILSSCPVGVNAALVVQGQGRNPTLVSSTTLLSSLGCVATMPMWLNVLANI